MFNLFLHHLFMITFITFLLNTNCNYFQTSNPIQSTNDKFIVLNYEKIYGIFQFYIRLGKPRQTFLIGLNMSTNITWISYYLYQKHKSSTIQILNDDTSFTLTNNTNDLKVPSLLIGELITIESIKEDNSYSFAHLSSSSYSIDKFMFYYPQINIPTEIGYDSIGSGFYYNNISFSLVHMFYQRNYISQISFGFIPKSLFKGIIYFGKLPPNLKTVKHSYKHILPIVNPKLTEWNVQLKSINYGKYPVDSNNHLIYFDSGETYICVPFNFIHYLNKEYFSTYIQERKCEYVESHLELSHYFYCKCKDINNFKSIVFNFGNKINIELTKNDLFEKDLTTCYFILRYCHIKNNNNTFVFGNSFFSLFPIEFNYETKSVIIYNDIPFRKNILNEAKINPMYYYCYWMLCYLNIFGIIINIILIIVNKVY